MSERGTKTVRPVPVEALAAMADDWELTNRSTILGAHVCIQDLRVLLADHGYSAETSGTSEGDD